MYFFISFSQQSYGGFVTAKTLAMSGEEEFQCGISIAPVSCKRYYGNGHFVICIARFELFFLLIESS